MAADVPASFINSQQTRAEVSAVFRELSKPRPTCKLLYITPEQFVKSTSLHRLLAGLHTRGLLARLVVDEVSPDTPMLLAYNHHQSNVTIATC